MGRNNDGPCGCLCRILNYGISLLLLAGIGAVIWHMLGRPSPDEILNGIDDARDDFAEIDFSDFADVLDNFTISDFIDGWEEDPFAGLGEVVGPVGEGNNAAVAQWADSSGYKGLSLELHNALDETWQDAFFTVVDEWDNGAGVTDIDPLELSTKNIDVDNACSPIEKVMKVCNGNYGVTGWLGINELITTVPQNIIQNSVAKMNEHYLHNADVIERQYTMCHEIGHGFGLAHTDENFFNADLGNCLDYTNFPENNLHPDTPNFETLANMYGTTDGTWTKQSYTTSELDDEDDGEDGDGEGDKKEKEEEEEEGGDDENINVEVASEFRDSDGGGRRQRGRNLRSSNSHSLPLTKELRSEYAMAMKELQYIHLTALSEGPSSVTVSRKENQKNDSLSSTTKSTPYHRLLEESSWNLMEWHTHGSSYYRIIQNTQGGIEGQMYKLEVHMLHAPPKYNTKSAKKDLVAEVAGSDGDGGR